MKPFAWLVCAGLAFSGAMMARATPSQPVSDAAVVGTGMPRNLSDYGFFADAAAQRPAREVHPYRLNTPLYSDGAEKLRFVYLPDGTQMKARGDGLPDLPVGAALIKTFAFHEAGKRRLIETRVLLHRADGWLALPYLWNEAQTDATLALAGAQVRVTTPRGEQIDYRVPNKNQCKECHGLNGAVTPIGPKLRNLSLDWLKDMVAADSLDAVAPGADALPLWEARSGASGAAAARAYLDVNCAHCHQPGGGASNSGLDLRWEQQAPAAIGVMKRPVAAGRGAGTHLYDVVPGHPEQSILLHRMLSTDPGVAMPELGKHTVDREGTDAVRRWIAEMPAS